MENNLIEFNGKKYNLNDLRDEIELEEMGYFSNKNSNSNNNNDKKVSYSKVIRKGDNWKVPINTSFLNVNKQDKNYMDAKAMALFTYFSHRKSQEVCDMLNIDISEVEEHRYLYKNFLNENIDKFEELSNWKKQNIYKQINKLTKANNKVFDVDYTENGDIYYKIIPYVDRENNLRKDGTFVTIESDVLRYLISSSNSNMIRVYCFLKWFLVDAEYYKKTKEVIYSRKTIDRKFILKQIGLSENSSKLAHQISQDIEKDLCAKGLIRRYSVTKSEFGKTKTSYEYEIVPYDEWLEYYNKLGKIKI